MGNKLINCKILTPEKSLFEGTAKMLVVPAYDGEMGILKGHSNLVARLSCGECRIEQEDSTDRFYVEGGVVKVLTKGTGENLQTEVILLSNASMTLEDLKGSKENLEKELEEAKNLVVTTDKSFQERLQSMNGAKEKMKLLEKIED